MCARKNIPYWIKVTLLVKRQAEPDGEEDNSNSHIENYCITRKALLSWKNVFEYTAYIPLCIQVYVEVMLMIMYKLFLLVIMT